MSAFCIAVRAWCNDDYIDPQPEHVVVRMTPAIARRLASRVTEARRALVAQRAVEIAFLDSLADWYEGDPYCYDAVYDAMYYDGLVCGDEPVMAETRMECQRMRVCSRYIRWSAIIKHSSIECFTDPIPVDLICDIARRLT